MRENNRKHIKRDVDNKIMIYVGSGIIAIIVLVIAIYLYNTKIENDIKQAKFNMDRITENIVDNETESASTSIGKSINEVKEKENTVTEDKVNNVINNNYNDVNIGKKSINVVQNNINNDSTTNLENVEKNVELNFEKPVDGEIIKEFAKDQLVYSNTLKEWITHNGIDIKAEKTSIVKAAEAGTIESIKNDPRYGLTVIIVHDNGFKTVYANLLTAEFVVEGEKVDKGQTLGTVGDTASFEIADEAHLHFEVLKDLQQVDPTIYVKY